VIKYECEGESEETSSLETQPTIVDSSEAAKLTSRRGQVDRVVKLACDSVTRDCLETRSKHYCTATTGDWGIELRADCKKAQKYFYSAKLDSSGLQELAQVTRTSRTGSQTDCKRFAQISRILLFSNGLFSNVNNLIVGSRNQRIYPNSWLSKPKNLLSCPK
jgi:hypothetical protein